MYIGRLSPLFRNFPLWYDSQQSMSKQSPIYEDESIIAGIQQGGAMREQWITRLYGKYFRFLHQGKAKHNISEEEAKDAYSDAVIAVSEQIAANKFRGDSKLSTYLYRIFYYKCVDIIRQKPTLRKVELQEAAEFEVLEADPLDQVIREEQLAELEGYLDQIGGKCKELLLDWGYWGYNMSEIAERMGFKDNKSAISQKHKCMQKLKSLLSKHMIQSHRGNK